MLFAPNDGLRQLAHGRWPCLFLFFGDPLDDEWCRGGDGAGVTGFDGGDGASVYLLNLPTVLVGLGGCGWGEWVFLVRTRR